MRIHWMSCCAVALMASACGDMLYAELEVPQVCKTVPGYQMPGIPIAAHGTTAIEPPPIKLGEGMPDFGGDATSLDVRLLSLQLKAVQGIEDFSFAEKLALRVQNPNDAAAEPQSLAEVDSASTQTDTDTLAFQVDSQNLVDYLNDGAIQVSTEITGDLPTVDWVVDVTVCGKMSGRVKYLEASQSL